MAFILRQVRPGRKLCQQLSLEALERAVPRTAIQEALQESHLHTPRERKLNLEVIVLLVIAMNLYAQESIAYVLHKMAQGLRLLRIDREWDREQETSLPGPSALVYRRYQLGVRPMAALFRRLCRPIATSETPGAFLFGLRLMALDGQVLDVPDTPQNAAYFGKSGSQRGSSAFPQVQAVYLCELGTHALVDAGFWPCRVSERAVASRLLRSVTPQMLVMLDRGLYCFARCKAVRQRNAHVLCRLPNSVQPTRVRPLSDGSCLIWITPAGAKKKTNKDQERLLMRLIEYTLTDPTMPGYQERYRLVTSLLDPDGYPARELAVAYHQRWEIEMTLDEIEVHQHLSQQGPPLRSKKPVGVLQELYGLLIAHWAVRFIMHEAAQKAGLDPDRLSFTHALRIIADAVRDFAIVAPEMAPRLYERMLEDIADCPLPPRRARSNPRVVKRKLSKFPLKRAEHAGKTRLGRTFEEAIALI